MLYTAAQNSLKPVRKINMIPERKKSKSLPLLCWIITPLDIHTVST